MEKEEHRAQLERLQQKLTDAESRFSRLQQENQQQATVRSRSPPDLALNLTRTEERRPGEVGVRSFQPFCFLFFGAMFCEALPVKVTLFFAIFMLGRIWREGDWNVLNKDVSSVNLFQTFPRHGFPQLLSTRLDSSCYFILNNTLYLFINFF